MSKIVTTILTNKKDDSRYNTAWYYIEDKVKEVTSLKKLKEEIITKYVNTKDTTPKDKDELVNAIKAVEDET